MSEQHPAPEYAGYLLNRPATVSANVVLAVTTALMLPLTEVHIGKSSHRESVGTGEYVQGVPPLPLPLCETLPESGNQATSTVELEFPVKMPYAREYGQDPNARVTDPANIASVVESLRQLQNSGFGYNSIKVAVIGHTSDEARVNPDGSENPDAGLGAPSPGNEELGRVRAEAVTAEINKVIQAEGITATVLPPEGAEDLLVRDEVATLRKDAALFELDLTTLIDRYNSDQPLPETLQSRLTTLLGDRRRASVKLSGIQTMVFGKNGPEHCLPTDTPPLHVPFTEKSTNNGDDIVIRLPIAISGVVIYDKKTAEKRVIEALEQSEQSYEKSLVPISGGAAELIPVLVATPGKELVHVPQTRSKELVPLSRLPACVENPSAYGDVIDLGPESYYEVYEVGDESPTGGAVEAVRAAIAPPQPLAIEAAPVRLAIEAAK